MAMMKLNQFSLLFLLLLSVALGTTTAKKKEPLCADPKTGVYVGLAVDEESYDSFPGEPGQDRETGASLPPQEWKLVYEGTERTSDIQGSLTGQYLQVLPDDGRSYPGRGQHISDIHELEDGKAPYISFGLRVQQPGWHTLFVRWTGGDGVGGGDSFYVALYDQKSKQVVRGQRTLKPAVVPINSANFAGCCYNPKTHACPCYRSQPTEQVCNSTYFIDPERAHGFNIQCRVGVGVMTLVDAPQWYLFAGQDVGNVMNFGSQPWDATCEAEGSNSADSGHDFPSWELPTGEYELRFYAREDGTALDAIYVAGPKAEAPGISQTYRKGESTLCPPNNDDRGRASSSSSLVNWGFGILLMGVVVKALATDKGRQFTEQVISLGGSALLGRPTDVNFQMARSSLAQYDQIDRMHEEEPPSPYTAT